MWTRSVQGRLGLSKEGCPPYEINHREDCPPCANTDSPSIVLFQTLLPSQQVSGEYPPEDEGHARSYIEKRRQRGLLLSFAVMVFVSLANKVFQKLETIPMYNYPNFLNLLTTFACECVCLLTREYPKTHVGTWCSKATYIVYATTFHLCTHADQDLVRCTNAGCTVADSYRVHILSLIHI